MRLSIAAALALTLASSLPAQDLATAVPLPGNWSYAQSADGGEATFSDANSNPQLWLHCTRASRQVTVARPATGAAPFITVWTSTKSQDLPSSFNPATNRLSANLWAFDPLLDAMAFSRGRIGFTIGAQTPLVVPPWEEVARVIEDCRV
jgi:hypothetical protein